MDSQETKPKDSVLKLNESDFKNGPAPDIFETVKTIDRQVDSDDDDCYRDAEETEATPVSEEHLLVTASNEKKYTSLPTQNHYPYYRNLRRRNRHRAGGYGSEDERGRSYYGDDDSGWIRFVFRWLPTRYLRIPKILHWIQQQLAHHPRLVAYLPEWFMRPNLESGGFDMDDEADHADADDYAMNGRKRKQTTASWGQQWEGFEYLSRRWKASKRLRASLAVTCIVGAILFLLWWFMLSPMLGLLAGTGGPLLGIYTGGPGAGLQGFRIDGFGRVIRSPLPLLDLLFRRAEYAQLRDQLSLLLSQRAETDIHEWWKKSGPPPSKEIAGRDGGGGSDSSTASGEAAGRSLFWDREPFITRVPDHHQEDLWLALCRDKAVRSLADGSGASASESVLLSDDGKQKRFSRSGDLQAFQKVTHRWLVDECAKGGQVKANTFVEAAQTHGALELDVSAYLSPIPDEITTLYEEVEAEAEPEPEPETPNEEEQEEEQEEGEKEREKKRKPEAPRFQQRHSDSTRKLVQDIMDLDNDDDDDDGDGDGNTKAKTEVVEVQNEEEEEKEKIQTEEPPEVLQLAPPEPEHVYRNISIYELHVTMAFMAGQAARVVVEKQTGSRLEQQLGHRIADAVPWFEPIQPTDARDPWFQVVSDELSRLQQVRFDALLDLRTTALWSGEGGCVCPHHLGVPINGAAWYEAGGPKGKVRVLFYPESDAVQRSTSRSDVGGIAGVFVSLFSKTPSSWSDRNKDALHQIEWRHADPVLNPLLYHEKKKKQQQQQQQQPKLELDHTKHGPDILRLPMEATQRAWTWVEGIDYRGQRRRYRVSPRSLACIQSCNRACSVTKE